VPPNAAVLDAPHTPGKFTGFLIKNDPNDAPLLLANIGAEHSRFELWQVTADAPHKFAVKRTARLDAAQDSWSGFLAPSVACLPGNRLLLAVTYYAPQVKEALYVYDLARNEFYSLGRVAPNTDDYDKFFEVQAVSADTAVVLYYTGTKRIAAEKYYNEFNHLRLYSPRYPQGVELLKLGVDDGNVTRWAIADRILFLQTIDKRDAKKPIERMWSLDLSKVL
jgi:hypothetical protein